MRRPRDSERSAFVSSKSVAGDEDEAGTDEGWCSGTHKVLPIPFQALGSHAPIVPTKILGDPDELDRHLVHSMPESYSMRQGGDTGYDNGYMYSQESDIEMHVSVCVSASPEEDWQRIFFSARPSSLFPTVPSHREKKIILFFPSSRSGRHGKMFSLPQARPGLIMDVVRNPMPIGAVPVIPAVPLPVQLQDLPVLTMEPLDINSLPEMERFTVELTKDIYGLGITIAGYVCEKGNDRPRREGRKIFVEYF